MKKTLHYSIAFSVYVIVIPIMVLFMADMAIRGTADIIGIEILSGDTGFKLLTLLTSLFFLLTIIYYVFCFLILLIRNEKARIWITAIFLVFPLISFADNDDSAFTVAIGFSMYHWTYYGLFFMARYLLNMHLFNEKSIIAKTEANESQMNTDNESELDADNKSQVDTDNGN